MRAYSWLSATGSLTHGKASVNISDLLHIWRDRVDFDELVKQVEALVEKFAPTHVFIERAGNGFPLFEHLKKRHKHGINGLNFRNSKEERAAQATNQFRDGKIKLPNGPRFFGLREREATP